MEYSLGIDIGGTNIKYVLMDSRRELIHSDLIKTNNYVDNIFEIIDLCLQKTNNNINKIGIGIPGTVDHNKGVIIDSPALNCSNVNIKEIINCRYDASVELDNDVNCWALAELEIGACKDNDNFVMITLGTGIGSSVIIFRKIYRGYQNLAGEIGYFTLDKKAYNEENSNLQFGYFEKIASPLGIENRYYKDFGEKKTAKEIMELYARGDEGSKVIVENAFDYIGLGINNIICLLSPEKIIIGGGMSKVGSLLTNALKDRVEKICPYPKIIEISKTGQYGGAIGSTLL